MVVVVTGGDPVDPAHVRALPSDAWVIAADSGIDHALAVGLRVHHAIGDFDSVSPEGLATVQARGGRVERHPAAKDATDLELALGAALERVPARVHVLGGHGGRLDHQLANALLLASPAYASMAITAQMGLALLTVVRDEAVLSGQVGDLVTLVPPHGVARRVTTSGLRYPLRGEDLAPGSTRGVSNLLVAPAATVRLDAGVLLAIQSAPLDRETHR
jgi:thiamine pyrophosphokinase